jgi:hypothetical protein
LRDRLQSDVTDARTAGVLAALTVGDQAAIERDDWELFRTTGIASQMAAKLGMAAEAMGGPAMFQALQTGALDAGEFIGPWTDSALGYYQVAPYFYWPGVGEPSSAEECGVNAAAYAELPDDLKEVVYTMRFDRASAIYADFGPFYTGFVTPVEALAQSL